MKKILSPILVILLIPTITQAASLQTLIPNVLTVTNTILIPFLLGIAFLIFVINVIRYFVIEGANEDGQEKARALATYAVAAFVFIVVFWGIINMLVSSLGLGGKTQPCPDYITTMGGSCT